MQNIAPSEARTQPIEDSLRSQTLAFGVLGIEIAILEILRYKGILPPCALLLLRAPSFVVQRAYRRGVHATLEDDACGGTHGQHTLPFTHWHAHVRTKKTEQQATTCYLGRVQCVHLR